MAVVPKEVCVGSDSDEEDESELELLLDDDGVEDVLDCEDVASSVDEVSEADVLVESDPLLLLEPVPVELSELSSPLSPKIPGKNP